MPSQASLPEQAAPGEEGVARLDHAELVALGVGQDDVLLLGALPDVEVAGAEPQRRRHRVLLVGAAGAGQVKVHAVRPHLLRAARDEPEAELGVLARQERTTGVLDDRPAEHAGPELRQASRVVRIEGHRQHSREHHRTVDTGQQDNKVISREGGIASGAGRVLAVARQISAEQPITGPQRLKAWRPSACPRDLGRWVR